MHFSRKNSLVADFFGQLEPHLRELRSSFDGVVAWMGSCTGVIDLIRPGRADIVWNRKAGC